MHQPYTLPLNQLDSTKVAVSGGKGASLGELMKVGVRVPPGFVVTRDAFDAFMAVADPNNEVAEWLKKVDSNAATVVEAERAIHDLLEHGAIPDDVRTAIQQGVDALDVESVSVRSSATCEDGVTSAWAGQLDTFLNVAPTDVLANVKSCWLSVFGAPALAYGAAHGYGAGQFGVAVVVQQMILSEVAGVGFSVHPVTQEPNVRLIEACFGQGEAIVSGKIIPDQYVVHRGAREIAEQSRGQQKKGLFFAHAEAKPHWQNLTDRGGEAKLTDAQVLEYAGLLDRIEDHYGHPIDTEWALVGDQFHLLQARPITTLAPEYRDPIVVDSGQWSRLVRRPLTLLEASIISYWLDSQYAGVDFGININRFMTMQETPKLVSVFMPTKEFDAAFEHICELDKRDRGELIALLKHGRDTYREGLDLLDSGRSFGSLDKAVDHFINIARYTTSFPAMTLWALDAGHIDDPEVRELAQHLRSRSLYPRYLSQLIDPLVCDFVRKLGFSEPERAPELLTWHELHNGSVNCETLNERLEEVKSDKLFVYERLGDDEKLTFVSETGYLIMREMGQRQIVAPDDPNRITGQAAWPGVHRGIARVVLSSDPEGYEVKDGEVLVSIQSNPNLMPLLQHAGAIVTDDGGVACHAGIICRELKIPTIIGTGRATTTIHEGDLVEVDATEQVVRILERA